MSVLFDITLDSVHNVSSVRIINKIILKKAMIPDIIVKKSYITS